MPIRVSTIILGMTTMLFAVGLFASALIQIVTASDKGGAVKNIDAGASK